LQLGYLMFAIAYPDYARSVARLMGRVLDYESKLLSTRDARFDVAADFANMSEESFESI